MLAPRVVSLSRPDPAPPGTGTDDAVRLLRVGAQGGVALSTPQDLCRWLVDAALALRPHERMVVAWGDFDGGEPQLELLARASEAPVEAQAQPLRMLAPAISGALRRVPAMVRGETAAVGWHSPIATLAPRASGLSERERQIMAWVAMGKTNPEIGCILRISEFTVKNHMKSIFTKLDVTNRAQAVAKMTRLAAHG